MISMRTLRNNGHVPPLSMVEPKQLGAVTESIQYMDRIATQSGVNISDWAIDEILYEKPNWVTDKNKINKLFFEYMEKTKNQVALEISEKDSAVLSSFSDSYFTSRCGDINANIGSKKERLHSFQSEILQLTAEIEELRHMKNFLKSLAKPDLKAQLNQIVAGGFWELESIEDGYGATYIMFVTCDDVMMFWHDEKYEADYRFSLGRFRLRFNLRKRGHFTDPICVSVTPYKNNVLFRGDEGNYFHPHIDSDGHVCLGGHITQFNKAMASCDLVTMAQIIRAILPDYNENSPYVNIEEFQEKYDRNIENLRRHREEANAIIEGEEGEEEQGEGDEEQEEEQGEEDAI